MQRVWESECQTHTEKLVLLALADNANDSGVCWPSIANIARKCGLSEQAVLNRLAALENKGWLAVQRASGKSNHYEINPPTPLTPKPSWGVNAVDHYPPTALGAPPHAVEQNHQEPSVEPSLPSPAKVKAKKQKPEVPNEAHAAFISGWTEAFAETFGDDYIFAGGKDGSAVKRLLKTGVPTADLLALARGAWGNLKLFNCKQAASIAGFSGRLNEIRAELRATIPKSNNLLGWEDEVNGTKL